MPDQLINDSIINALLISAQFILVYLGIVWLCVVYWTYRDARRRNPDVTVAIGSALFVLFFFLPGYWIYLLVRPRVTIAEAAEDRARLFLLSEYMRQCPSCATTVGNDYVVCPKCRTRLKASCADCGKPVDSSWVACAYCATVISTELPSPTPVAPEITVGEPVHA